MTTLDAALRDGQARLVTADQDAQFTSAAYSGRVEQADTQIS